MSDQCVYCTARGDLDACMAAKCSIHESWYVETIKAKYNELIMAVESKYEGETRHETALRYIGESERAKGFYQGGVKNGQT